MEKITLHSLTLSHVETFPNGYSIARDRDGHLRIHNGKYFQGYVTEWSSESGEKRFAVHIFPPGRKDFFSYGWRTQRGAENALKRFAKGF